jgi:hypothetical protein
LPSHVQIGIESKLQWLAENVHKFATNNLATRYWLLAVMSLTWANMMKSTAGFHSAKTLIQGGIVADVGESAFVVTRVAAPVV